MLQGDTNTSDSSVSTLVMKITALSLYEDATNTRDTAASFVVQYDTLDGDKCSLSLRYKNNTNTGVNCCLTVVQGNTNSNEGYTAVSLCGTRTTSMPQMLLSYVVVPVQHSTNIAVNC